MLVCHLTQDTLEVRRLGRGAIERGRARTDLHPKGADHPRAPSGPGQHRIEEIRGRAFPVCPGDADERERAGRLAEEGAAEGGQGDAGVGDHDLCHTWGHLRRSLHNHRRGATGDRLRHERMPVVLQAWNGHEKPAGPDRLGMVGDISDRGRR